MFVLMISGYALTRLLPEDPALSERFWYWRGASGQSYIHSIYRWALCPKVAGAVYLVVRKSGDRRQVISVGRFASDGTLPAGLPLDNAGDEIHVHLLARDAGSAERICRDLRHAFEADGSPEPLESWPGRGVQLELLAA